MSAGRFIDSFYELDAGNGGGQCRIKVQPETELLTDGTVVNDSPGGPATIPVSAKVSGSNGEYGIKPRKITIRWDDGQIPDGYDGLTVTVPVLTVAAFAAYTLGSTVTYLGGTGDVVGRTPERVR